MNPLSNPYTIRSVDLRNLIEVSAPTLGELCKKLNVKFVDESSPKGASKFLYSTEVRKILEARGYQYPSSARVISFMMCKGGVGKTTSSYFLSQRLSAYGARVLAIDADSQGNLTSAFNLPQYGMEVDEETPILVDVVVGEIKIEQAIIPITPNMHLLPSTPMNANLEGRIRENYKNPSLAMKSVIEPLLNDYDYILIDCAPALNLTNTAIVSASELVILPVAPDKFSQLGLEQTLSEIKQIEADFKTSIDTKIIFTKYDAREFTSLKYLTEIAHLHENMRFSTAIRTCADVKNVITKREDLYALKKSNAKEDYDAFACEVMGLDKFFKNRRTGGRVSAGAA